MTEPLNRSDPDRPYPRMRASELAGWFVVYAAVMAESGSCHDSEWAADAAVRACRERTCARPALTPEQEDAAAVLRGHFSTEDPGWSAMNVLLDGLLGRPMERLYASDRTRARRAHEGHTTRLAGILGVSESANTMDDLLDLLAGRAPTRGADGLNYLAAKSDAVMWESRAKKLAESISREIGPAADGVADEDLWELVQALAAARGDS